MRVQLLCDFLPFNDDWGDYCKHALKVFHELRDKSVAKIVAHPGSVFELQVPPLAPCYFRFSDPLKGIQTHNMWAVLLGPNHVLRPFVRTVPGGFELVVLLEFDADRITGVWRLCHSIVINAGKMREEDLVALKELAGRLTA